MSHNDKRDTILRLAAAHRDASARRAQVRAKFRASEKSDERHAVLLADGGFGIESICTATGLPRDVVSILVTGEA